jgi:hypothetical protein
MTIKKIILDDAAIRRLLNTPAVVQAFPFMQTMVAQEQKRATSSKKRECGGCRRKANAQFSRYDGIRTAIAGMSQADKDRLKKLIGVDQIKIYFLNTKKQRVNMVV